MRANIKDIMKATKCDEIVAAKIESRIDYMSLIDWSRDSSAKIKKASIEVHKIIVSEGN